jgi:hypothetical protein
MSVFKERKSKSDNLLYKRTTIDAKHTSQIKFFKDRKKSITQLSELLSNKEVTFLELSKIDKKDMNEETLETFLNIKDDIRELKDEITEIESNEDENRYYLDTGHLMFNYYDKFKNNINSSSPVYIDKKDDNSKKNVLSFFQKNIVSNSNPNSIKKKYNSYSKSNIINSYLSKVEKNFIYPFEIENNIDFCEKCNKEKKIIASEGIIICTTCGTQNTIIIDSDKPSYKDPPREISYFAYKRINHFNEWLAQFQAKESTEIPQEVFDKILIEIKKERIDNMASLSPNKLRIILKKLKLNKFYEHVPHIINRLNGLPAPVMTRDTEEKLRMMFKEIQTPFLKFCPKERKNFLSYSYVLHKFVQLLGLDEFLICFPLLKSREKLHQQDQIWKNICEELQWEFIKSL